MIYLSRSSGMLYVNPSIPSHTISPIAVAVVERGCFWMIVWEETLYWQFAGILVKCPPRKEAGLSMVNQNIVCWWNSETMVKLFETVSSQSPRLCTCVLQSPCASNSPVGCSYFLCPISKKKAINSYMGVSHKFEVFNIQDIPKELFSLQSRYVPSAPLLISVPSTLNLVTCQFPLPLRINDLTFSSFLHGSWSTPEITFPPAASFKEKCYLHLMLFMRRTLLSSACWAPTTEHLVWFDSRGSSRPRSYIRYGGQQRISDVLVDSSAYHDELEDTGAGYCDISNGS